MKKTIGLALLLFPCFVFSGESSKSVKVKSLEAIAGNRDGSNINTISVTTDPVNWGNGCGSSSTISFLRKEDTHLVSILLTAMSTGQSIVLMVDDSRPKIYNNCQIVSVGVIP